MKVYVAGVEWFPVYVVVRDPELLLSDPISFPDIELTEVELARVLAADAEFRACQDVIWEARKRRYEGTPEMRYVGKYPASQDLHDC